MAIEIRLQPLDTWAPGAIRVCVGNELDRYDPVAIGPAEKWARLEWREGEMNITWWTGTDWKPVKLAD